MENESTVGTEHVLNPWKHLCSLGTHLCLHLPHRKQTGLMNREQRTRLRLGWQRENSKRSQFWFWSTPLARLWAVLAQTGKEPMFLCIFKNYISNYHSMLSVLYLSHCEPVKTVHDWHWSVMARHVPPTQEKKRLWNMNVIIFRAEPGGQDRITV